MIARLQHFLNTLRTSWSEDPAARGAAKMTAGAVLVVEGLFGVIRGAGRRTRKGGRSVGGIVGGILGIVMGIVFVTVGGFVTPTMPDDAIETTGTITDVAASRSSEGQQMFSPVIEFRANDGQTYEFTQGMRSSSRPTVGAEVTVVYSESNPENAHRTDGIGAWAPWAFRGAGIFIIVSSVVSLMISIALIVFGIILFNQGRADRRSVGASGGFFSDLVSLMSQARSGGIDVAATAAGRPDGSQGDADGLFGNRGEAATAGPAGPSQSHHPAPSPAAPPAGWYVDPGDKSLMRWWDGMQWGEHSRPKEE